MVNNLVNTVRYITAVFYVCNEIYTIFLRTSSVWLKKIVGCAGCWWGHLGMVRPITRKETSTDARWRMPVTPTAPSSTWVMTQDLNTSVTLNLMFLT